MILLAILAAVAGDVPSVELATPSDCEIVVEVGRAEAGWGAAGPNQPFVDEGPLPNGTIYKQKCDWRALGVGAPKILTPGQTGPRFAIEKPIYSEDGRAARTSFNFFIWPGPGTAPFFSIRHCSLRMAGGHWHLVSCEQGPIT
jgi:hypothetical protein